jgi:hypothetical protein
MDSRDGISASDRKRRHGSKASAKEARIFFVVPKWAGSWAALGGACTSAVFLLDLPAFVDMLMYLTTLVSGFELITEMHGVRVTPTDVAFPVRPSNRFPIFSLWVNRVELDEISRITARKTSTGYQLVNMKTASGDLPVYFASHLKRREFSHLLGELRPALVFRKNR